MMEYDFADKLDLEWHGIFQKHLKYFSYKNKSETYSVDDILKEVFCPDPNAEQDVKYEDKEIFEECLTEALNLLSNRSTPPRQTQIRYLLNIAKYVSKDESCFININSSNVLLSLIYLSQSSTDINTKLLFMELLRSFLDHPSGVKWLMETKYWTEVFASTVNYQNIDDRVSQMGYEILRILLEKTVEMDTNYCDEIMKLTAEPLLNTAQQIKSMATNNPLILQGLKTHITCLVKILEDLLKNYSTNVLRYIMNLKVGLASDAVCEKCNDMAVCLLLNRITIILAFYGLTEVFDGIKFIQQDPLVLSGFITIINREVDKGCFSAVFELYYYALKYLKHISDKLPKYFFRDKQIDIEGQLVALQLEPMLLEWVRLDGATDLLEETDSDLVPMSHPLKMFKNLWLKTLHIGFKIKDKLPVCSFDVNTNAVKNIMRSSKLYSKKSLCDILDSLVYSLEAPLKYIQSKKNETVTIEHAQQVYILALLDATLVFIESFDINWHDSVKVLDLLYIVIEGCCSYQWIEPIVLDSLILLQKIISRRFSPSMALLIDTADGLKNIGPLLYRTCFTNDWTVRKAVLEVVHTITVSANNCFLSFKTVLLDASLPSLISTMAFNDESLPVRATALQCIQQMIVMDDVKEVLPKNILINKVLDFIMKNIDPDVTKEAIKLIAIIYQHDTNLDKDITMKVYKCLEYVAVSNNKDSSVQKEFVEFWRTVTRKVLTKAGWVDTLFPAVTFSKKIVCLNHEEVNKRYFKVLSELSRIGTLNVFERLWQFNDIHGAAKKSLIEVLYRLHYNFSTHKITPESMSFNQEFLDLSSIQIDSLVSQESEDILQEIISDTIMKMTPIDLEFVNNKDPLSLMDTDNAISNVTSVGAASTSQYEVTRRLTPSEFVALVYKRVTDLSSNGDPFSENPLKKNDVYIIDY